GESLQLAAEAMTLWHEGPLSLPAQTHALQRFMVYLETGRLGELADTFTTLTREFPALPAWRSRVALIHIESGRPEEACALLDGLAARGFADLPRDSNFLSALATFALVVERLEDPARAALLYPLLLPHADCYVSVGFAAGTYGACARYLGVLAGARGGSRGGPVRRLCALLGPPRGEEGGTGRARAPPRGGARREHETGEPAAH